MTGMLSEQDLSALTPSELCPHRTPIPTQAVSSDEYYPPPQNEKQREVEARLLAMADALEKNRVSTGGAFSRPPRAWRRPLWR